MPFTISHAVIAQPISYITGYRLPIAGLVIGSITPDLYRLFTQEQSNITHMWSGLFSLTLWLAFGFSALWYLIYRPAIYRFLGIQHELKINSFLAALNFLILLFISIVIGIATHLIWDGLTHVDSRNFAFQHFLSQSIHLFDHTYPLHRVLQLGTSAIVLPIIYSSCLNYYKEHHQHFKVSPKIKVFAWGLFLISILLGICAVLDYLRYLPIDLIFSNLYYFTGRFINEFSQIALIIFSFGCILFLFLDRNHRLD